MTTLASGSFFGFKVQIVDSVTLASISGAGYAKTPSMTKGDLEEFVNLLKGGFAGVYKGYASPMPSDPSLIFSSFRLFGGVIAVLEAQVPGKKIKRNSKLANGPWKNYATAKDFDTAFKYQPGPCVLEMNSKSSVLAGKGFLRRALRYLACLWLSEHGRALLRAVITGCTTLGGQRTLLLFPAAAPVLNTMATPYDGSESMIKNKHGFLETDKMNEFGGFQDSAGFGQVASGQAGAVYIDVTRVDGAGMYADAKGLTLEYSSIPVAKACEGKPPEPNGPGCYIQKIKYSAVGTTFEFIRFGHELVHVLAATKWPAPGQRFPATYASIVSDTQHLKNACLANDLLAKFAGGNYKRLVMKKVTWSGDQASAQLDQVKVGDDEPLLTNAIRSAIVEMATITGKVTPADNLGISGKICGVDQALSENSLNFAYGRPDRGTHLSLGVKWLMIGQQIKDIIGDDDIDQGLTGAGSTDLEMNLSASVQKLLKPNTPKSADPGLLDFGVISKP